LNNLKGKVALISGAGTGLGKETAIAFAKAGADLVICGRHLDKLEQVKELIIGEYNVDVLAVCADVSLEADVHTLFQEVNKHFGKIDILVNNAADFNQYKVIECPLDSFEYILHNNTTSVFLMMRECLPFMRNQKSGHIINITSGLAREGAAGFGAYAASKAAVEALTFTVEDEEHKNGIQVHAFNPGVMKTSLFHIGDDPANVAPYILQLAQTKSLHEKRVIELEDFPLSVEAKI
jgi:3-oxoacyl-[acyl-carrier protein] reductase